MDRKTPSSYQEWPLFSEFHPDGNLPGFDYGPHSFTHPNPLGVYMTEFPSLEPINPPFSPELDFFPPFQMQNDGLVGTSYPQSFDMANSSSSSSYADPMVDSHMPRFEPEQVVSNQVPSVPQDYMSATGVADELQVGETVVVKTEPIDPNEQVDFVPWAEKQTVAEVPCMPDSAITSALCPPKMTTEKSFNQEKETLHVDEQNQTNNKTADNKPQGPVPFCRVCMITPSRGFHFGVLSCIACAAFFRRTVAGRKKYVCKQNEFCKILLRKESGYRKVCRQCRLNRCYKAGMLRGCVQMKNYHKSSRKAAS